jgi:hypothetical protein
MFDVSTSTTTVAASDCTMSARETAGRSSMAVDQSRAPGRSATIRDESGENVSCRPGGNLWTSPPSGRRVTK